MVETSAFLLKDSWLAALMFDVLCAGMFVMMISPLVQSTLAERVFNPLHAVSCQNQNCMSTVVF